MKKAIAWILLTVTIFSVAGCGSPGADKPDAPTGETYTDLRVVTNNMGRGVRLTSAATPSGYYETIPWTYEMYEESSPWMHISNILYTDYATQTRVYLCGVPGCAHNNENCTSYIRYPYSNLLFTNSTQTMLFFMAKGATGGEIYVEDDLGRIYRMDMDGSNRREIYRLKANENFSLSDPVIADETHLFACVEVTTDAVGGYAKMLRQINVHDGDICDLLELEMMEFMVAAYEDIIVIADGTATSHTRYYGYSVSQGKTMEFCEETNQVLAAENYLFFISEAEDGSGVLTIYDVKSGEKKVFENLPKEPGRVPFAYDYFDNKLHWAYIDSTEEENKHEYIIDCQTGKATEKTLRYEQYLDGTITRMVLILADAGDSFLVVMDSVDSSLTLTDREGIPYVYDWPGRGVYALISKADYWNNNPNYILINDTVSD